MEYVFLLVVIVLSLFVVVRNGDHAFFIVMSLVVLVLLCLDQMLCVVTVTPFAKKARKVIILEKMESINYVEERWSMQCIVTVFAKLTL